jgi:hypothetical protein
MLIYGIAIEAINALPDSDKKNSMKNNLQTIFKTPAKSSHRNKDQRVYEDLLKGRFITNIIRIDRSEDVNDISNKLFDYSQDTIKKLWQDGYEDTKRKLQK